jgi:hypothetical protein
MDKIQNEEMAMSLLVLTWINGPPECHDITDRETYSRLLGFVKYEPYEPPETLMERESIEVPPCLTLRQWLDIQETQPDP